MAMAEASSVATLCIACRQSMLRCFDGLLNKIPHSFVCCFRGSESFLNADELKVVLDDSKEVIVEGRESMSLLAWCVERCDVAGNELALGLLAIVRVELIKNQGTPMSHLLFQTTHKEDECSTVHPSHTLGCARAGATWI